MPRCPLGHKGPTLTAQQLQNARAVAWRQAGQPLLTTEDAAAWLREAGIALFLPRTAQIAAPTGSFVEATLGEANATPGPAAIENATSLLRRLLAGRDVSALNLLGIPGDQPDFLVSEDTLPFLFALRGDREWTRGPRGKSSPLVVEVWKLLVKDGALSAQAITERMGRHLTESAILRALTELWTALRVEPVSTDDEGTRWQLLEVNHEQTMVAGSAMAQGMALSALVSLYLQTAVAATAEEIEAFLSPVASRSRIRDAVRGLTATRQLGLKNLGAHEHFFVEGSLPEFATEAVAESTDFVSRQEASHAAGKPAAKRPVRSTEHISDEDYEQDTPAAPSAETKPEPIVAGEFLIEALSDAETERERTVGEGRKRFVAQREASSSDRRGFGGRPAGSGGRPSFAGRAGAARPGGSARPSGSRPGGTRPGGFGARPGGSDRGKSFGAGKPFTPREGGDRKPFTPREGGDRKPFAPREGADKKPFFANEPWKEDRPARPHGSDADAGARPQTGARKPFVPREGGDRKPFAPREGGRSSFGGGERKPFTPREGGSASFGDRKPFSPREGGERKPFVPREGSRASSSFGARKPFAPRQDGDRKPFAPREGGGRPAFGDRKPFSPRDGGKPSFGARKPFAPREGGERRPYPPREGGSRPASSDRKPFTPREGSRPAFGGSGGANTPRRTGAPGAAPKRFSPEDGRPAWPGGPAGEGRAGKRPRTAAFTSTGKPRAGVGATGRPGPKAPRPGAKNGNFPPRKPASGRKPGKPFGKGPGKGPKPGPKA
jgi:23S rRNA pseudouridine2605 synthase